MAALDRSGSGGGCLACGVVCGSNGSSRLRAISGGLLCYRWGRSFGLWWQQLVCVVFLMDAYQGLQQFGFRQGKGVDDAFQVTCRLVE